MTRENMLHGFINQLLIVQIVLAETYNNLYGPSYGSEWMLFMDEEGQVYNIDTNITDIELNSRGFMFGEVYFYIFDRMNMNKVEIVDVSNLRQTISSLYDPSKKTKIITHGWLSSASSPSVTSIASTYLRQCNYNVIAVDWSEIALNPLYAWAAVSTQWVGRQVATLMDTIADTYNTPQDVHLIGHSLGAHVMGAAGSLANSHVSRITGLDPARPLFEIPHFLESFSLDKSDADFVDIIHTCGGLLGFMDAHGHADFYPNNGQPMQPGCSGIQLFIEGCSHGRAYELFAESIMHSRPFTSWSAVNWTEFAKFRGITAVATMGEHARSTTRGIFYLHTRSTPPYTLGDCISKCGEDCCDLQIDT